MTKFFFLFLFLFGVQSSYAQLLVNEVKINPPGTDNPYEYIELRGQPGASLVNTYLVIFEGDSASSGIADLVIPLNGITIGANGLIFIGTSLGYPSISPATVFKDSLIFGVPGGYIENGSNTFMTVFSPSPILTGVDYDTNDDGVLEMPFGMSIIDAVGYTNNNAGAKVYGSVNLTQLGFTPDALVRFYDNTTPNSAAAWYSGDLAGAPATLNFDLTQVSSNFPTDGQLTPGDHNVPNSLSISNQISQNNTTAFLNQNLLSMHGFEFNRLAIYSVNGALIQRFELSNPTTSIEIAELASGLYIIEAENKTTRFATKLFCH